MGGSDVGTRRPRRRGGLEVAEDDRIARSRQRERTNKDASRERSMAQGPVGWRGDWSCRPAEQISRHLSHGQREGRVSWFPREVLCEALAAQMTLQRS